MLRPCRGVTGRPINVLFLCTGNSARSILAEALLDREGGDRVHAFSAGSQPRGAVHPEALALLAGRGFETASLRSKSWVEFAGPDAPRMNFIFTVCGNAAAEACPVWPGHPATAHWGIEDPAEAPPEQQAEAFAEAFDRLQARIELFLALPLETQDPASLSSRLAEIGCMDADSSAG